MPLAFCIVNFVLFMDVDQINLLNTYLEFKALLDEYLAPLSCAVVLYVPVLFLVPVFFLLEIKQKLTSFHLSPQFQFLCAIQVLSLFIIWFASLWTGSVVEDGLKRSEKKDDKRKRRGKSLHTILPSATSLSATSFQSEPVHRLLVFCY